MTEATPAKLREIAKMWDESAVICGTYAIMDEARERPTGPAMRELATRDRRVANAMRLAADILEASPRWRASMKRENEAAAVEEASGRFRQGRLEAALEAFAGMPAQISVSHDGTLTVMMTCGLAIAPGHDPKHARALFSDWWAGAPQVVDRSEGA